MNYFAKDASSSHRYPLTINEYYGLIEFFYPKKYEVEKLDFERLLILPHEVYTCFVNFRNMLDLFRDDFPM